uniref:TFIIS N-terminal domain-containing protein n=1 Tax=Heterorhabditis bacteriophora TaxID=37862 RepID=A0A1I7XJI9_HETBA
MENLSEEMVCNLSCHIGKHKTKLNVSKARHIVTHWKERMALERCFAKKPSTSITIGENTFCCHLPLVLIVLIAREVRSNPQPLWPPVPGCKLPEFGAIMIEHGLVTPDRFLYV